MYRRGSITCIGLVLAGLFLFQTGELHAQNPKNTIFLPVIGSSNTSVHSTTESEEELAYEQKYNRIRDLLTTELKATILQGQQDPTEVTFEWVSQDDTWIYGYVFVQQQTDFPPDAYNFLVRIEGDSISIAYMYSPRFDEWLDLLPETIIELESRRYMYSSVKYAQVSGVSLASIESGPQLSFPWRVGNSWRFTSGPHHKDGPNHNEHPWSGLDFGIPYDTKGNVLDQTVVMARGGGVLAIVPDCYVTIGIEGGWAVRYLHVKEITANTRQSMPAGTPIAKVPLTGACHTSDGPHLHIDLLFNGVPQDFDGHWIGGWQVKQGSTTYQGTLNMPDSLQLNRSTARTGPTAKYVMNMGSIGDNWQDNTPMTPAKQPGGVSLCSPDQCYFANHGMTLSSTFRKEIDKVLLTSGYKVEFYASGSTVASENGSTDPDATSMILGCLDFDVADLQNYNFPGTERSLRESSIQAVVFEGTCNPANRPIRKGSSTTSPDGNPTTEEAPINYGCGNQITGVKFHNNGGDCFYMTAGKASLPFSPTSIEVLDANRKYDITMCNEKGSCNEFHKTGSIDYSSVHRPFTRAEVVPQGLVGTDAVGSCRTSTGRKVEFAMLQAGVKYYTDRSYTVKNIDKHELVGMRFLKTPNDDKMNRDPEYITCDIKKTTQVVIAFDGRNRALPSWMRGSPYERINREIGVTDDSMQHFDLYACTQRGGYKLRLGGTQSDGSSGAASTYIIIFRDAAQDKATDCSAKFNVPPDTPVLREVPSADPLYSAPLLEWSMSDRNSSDDYLQAYIRIWRNRQLLSSVEWLPIGVIQWVPLWDEPGEYKAQVVVRDSKGMETASNTVSYRILSEPQQCLVSTE